MLPFFRLFFPDEDRYNLVEFKIEDHCILWKIEDMADGLVEIRQVSAEWQGYAASPKADNFETADSIDPP